MTTLDAGKPGEERFCRVMALRGYIVWHNAPYQAIDASFVEQRDAWGLLRALAIKEALGRDNNLGALALRSNSDYCVQKDGILWGKIEVKGEPLDNKDPNFSISVDPIVIGYVCARYLGETIWFACAPTDETEPIRMIDVVSLADWITHKITMSSHATPFSLLYRHDSETIAAVKARIALCGLPWTFAFTSLARAKGQDPFVLIPRAVVASWLSLDDVFGPAPSE